MTPRTLTLSGREVARVGYGAMQLTHGGDVEPATAVAVLRQAIQAGANHIDTAQFYGAGACNSLIREALAPYPDTLFLATKVGADNAADGSLVPAQLPDQLRAQVEANLATLGVDRLDVVYLRRLDAAPGIVAEGGQLVDIDAQLAELSALRDEGKIGAIGLSAVTADQVRKAAPVGIGCVQNMYGVLDRAQEPVLEACRGRGIAWVPFFPLGSAFPGRSKASQDPAVAAVARTVGATPAQVALAWLLRRYERTLLIPGTANAAHLEENFGAADVTLDAAAMARLDTLAAPTAAPATPAAG
jgi:aryl-alcohol dehydrogenase-like predicted oxidoreductase